MSSASITKDIIQHSLQAAADEMFAAMRRTAMSAIIYEVLDMGTGITDSSGELVGSGAGIPTFVGMLDKAVRSIIEKFPGKGQVRDGDVFMVNDPYSGGVTHLNDIILAAPVFAGGALIAWTADAAHFTDIGGMVPGSMSTEAREIFQEGLCLSPIKLFSRGEPLQSVIRILKANSRLPDFLEGDLWAGIAALRLGRRRVRELALKFGLDLFREALTEYLDYGEKVTLAGLRRLPRGRTELAEEQENGEVYRVAVEIKEDSFLVDLRESPDQDKGPFNLSREGSVIAAQMVLKSITSPETVCNGGTFRPLKVLTRKGSVFEPHRPAAMGFYYEVRIRLYDLLWRALAKLIPGRLPAGHFASICGTLIGGLHPETGRPYSIIEPELGGWGGSPRRDGNPAMFSACHGETYNCPVEVSERRHGLLVDRHTLNLAPGGEGFHRGGPGIVLDYRIRSEKGWLTASYSRSVHPPWPLEGGREGSPNYIEVIRRDGGRERYSSVTKLDLEKGDVVRVVTGKGGGWGDPRKREPEKIAADLKNGYLTPDRAARIYGYKAS